MKTNIIQSKPIWQNNIREEAEFRTILDAIIASLIYINSCNECRSQNDNVLAMLSDIKDYAYQNCDCINICSQSNIDLVMDILASSGFVRKYNEAYEILNDFNEKFNPEEFSFCNDTFVCSLLYGWGKHCLEISKSKINLDDSLSVQKRIKNVIQSMSPYAFENFSKILLEKNGFTDVNVTKRSGDGGIDGYGKLKINDMLSLSVAFQCKRYSEDNPVPVSAIRDFRGSLTADIDKGIFITTGTFGKGAVEEASVQGKQRIDLIDGEAVIDQILKYGIGVQSETVYVIDEDFFNNLGDENND